MFDINTRREAHNYKAQAGAPMIWQLCETHEVPLWLLLAVLRRLPQMYWQGFGGWGGVGGSKVQVGAPAFSRPGPAQQWQRHKW
jgi:hypothetical protein